MRVATKEVIMAVLRADPTVSEDDVRSISAQLTVVAPSTSDDSHRSAGAAVETLSARSTATGPNAVLPFNLNTEQTIRTIGSPRLFQRLRHHKWIKPLYPSRDAIYPMRQLVEVQRRLENGERPPPLPSELKRGMSKESATDAAFSL